MTAIRESAPAKINLYLHVGGARADGLHDLASLFVFTEHGDDIIAAPDDDLSLTIDGPFAAALRDDALSDNLVLRAANALRDRAGICRGAKLHLVKNLPVAAGVGGGSADAAAALRALARLWDVSLPAEALRALAFELGADVPACLDRAPVFVDGAGERLSPAPALAPVSVLLVNPGVEMPTGPVFRRFDADHPDPPTPTHPFFEGRPALNASQIMAASRNDLEAPALAIAPAIGELLQSMRGQDGALAARMSGSGATCFALFTDDEAASKAHAHFAAQNLWAMVSPIASG